MRLVYLSPVPWKSFAQRPHKFVEWFHSRTGGPVLWIDPYPTRFPHWRDLQSSRAASSRGAGRNPPAWLELLQPHGLPIEPMPGSGWVNGPLWRSEMTAVDGFAGRGRTVLVIGKPSVLALQVLDRLRSCSSIYDAMDDFPAFYTGLSRLALRRRERDIARRVDTILASSSALRSRWMAAHADVRLVHNALDLPALRSVRRRRVSSGAKVFGYVGTIASWFDWTWVRALAEARPDDEIRLVGPLFDRPDDALPGNVSLLPALAHAEALEAMAAFHVGIIPFRKNALTASVDPIKYYEYRALGLPVISTDFGEMSLRTGERGVFVARTATDIPGIAEAASGWQADEEEASAFAGQNSWTTRFDEANILPTS